MGTVLRALVAVLATALGLTALVASPAEAAPPANDDIANATRISTLPATFTLDTSEATGTRDDGRCVGGASVWFRFRPATDTTLRLNTVGGVAPAGSCTPGTIVGVPYQADYVFLQR